MTGRLLDETKAAFLHAGKEAAIGSAYPFTHGDIRGDQGSQQKNNKIGKENDGCWRQFYRHGFMPGGF